MKTSTPSFPNGILMIGRFMLLSVFSIIFRYFSAEHLTFQVPDGHLVDTAYNLVYLSCGLLLISKQIKFVKIALLLILIIIVRRIAMTAFGEIPLITPVHYAFFLVFLVLHVFFFVYIRNEINKYQD